MTDPRFTPAERELLDRAIAPIPLSEERLQRTLAAARADRAGGGAPKGPRRWLRHTLRLAVVAAVVGLGAAVAWRWNGENSDKDLSMDQAIRVLRDPSRHDENNQIAAMGRIGRIVRWVAKDLREHGHLPPELASNIRRHVEAPPRPSQPYLGDFDALTARLSGPGAPSPEDLVEFERAILHAIDAVREAGQSHAELRRMSQRFFGYLVDDVQPMREEDRQGVEQPSTPGGNDGGDEKGGL